MQRKPSMRCRFDGFRGFGGCCPQKLLLRHATAVARAGDAPLTLHGLEQCQFGSMSLHSLCISTAVCIGLPCKMAMEWDCCKAACRATASTAICGCMRRVASTSSVPPCLQGTNRSTLPCPLHMQDRRIWPLVEQNPDYNLWYKLCLYFKTSKSSAPRTSHLHRTLHPLPHCGRGMPRYATPLPFAVTARTGPNVNL